MTRYGKVTLKKEQKEGLQNKEISANQLQQSDDRITKVVFRVLEPYEGKLSCTVLRGEREGNLPDLLDRTGLPDENIGTSCNTAVHQVVENNVPRFWGMVRL